MAAAKQLPRQLDMSSLIEKKTREGKTCFHLARTSRDPGLLRELAAKLRDSGFEKGDTAVHLAVRRRSSVELIKQLVEFVPNLCGCANKNGETPLKLAVRLGSKEAVEFLTTSTSNALHCIVDLNQVKLVEYLIEREVKLSELINQPYKPATNSPVEENFATNLSEDGRDQHRMEKSLTDTDTQDDQPILRPGDTPLHIAARNKYEHMVNLLLKVPEVNKHIRNNEDKTPLDIAREVTEYHESFRIIKKLANYIESSKQFMYCTPEVSHKKYNKARLTVNKAYEERRNAELIVAALLAAMTCAAAFTLPGGFDSNKDVKKDLGSPILVSYISFKLFIIFDCIAFFLSLFVCILWEMSSDLTIANKMVFMTVTSLLVCWSFGFTAFGFMSAVYAMMAHKVKTLSLAILGTLIVIALCGVLAFIRQSVHFIVKRARFHRLCGVSLFLDDIVVKVWSEAERYGLLNFPRSLDDIFHDLISGHARFRGQNNSHSSPSCCFNHV